MAVTRDVWPWSAAMNASRVKLGPQRRIVARKIVVAPGRHVLRVGRQY